MKFKLNIFRLFGIKSHKLIFRHLTSLTYNKNIYKIKETAHSATVLAVACQCFSCN